MVVRRKKPTKKAKQTASAKKRKALRTLDRLEAEVRSLPEVVHETTGELTPGWHDAYMVVVLSADKKEKLDKLLAEGDAAYKELTDIRWQKIDEWSVPDAEDETMFIAYQILAHKEGNK